jgi:hypothetical protein
MNFNNFKNFEIPGWTANEDMTETAAKIANELEALGVHVCGSAADFGYAEGEDSVWISAESTPELFEYWEMRVDAKCEKVADKYGYYFEWNDPGTIMVYPV